MKKLKTTLLILVYITCLLNSISQAQQVSIAGFDYSEIDTGLTTNTAYGQALGGYYAFYTLSMPIPEGVPLTYNTIWPGYGTSMCIGGDGNYYITLENGKFYEFYPQTGIVSMSGINMLGLQENDHLNGIAYNPKNGKYYLAAGSYYYTSDNIYELDINTGVATLIGPTGTGGLQADLTISCDGICYSYDLVTNNSYTIDLSTGTATLLGPLGFDPQYLQGMDVDRENDIIYLSAYTSTNFGQLRILDPITGGTTLVVDWGYTLGIPAFAISSKCDLECLLDAPINPNPPSGTNGIPVTFDTLTWENSIGTTHIELYFGEIWDMGLVYDGPAIDSFIIPQLQDQTLYAWRVVSRNDTCKKYGSVWMFSTLQEPTIDCLFEDNFEQGIGNWTIASNNGTCIWEIYTPPYPSYYTLPPTSSGGILAADADNCGSGTTIHSTATISQIFDFSPNTWVWIEFDNDLRANDALDEAHIEVSTDGGTSWINVWSQSGEDIRNTNEKIDVSVLCAGNTNIKFRFRSVQPGWDWWWAIDNVKICGIICNTCVPFRPTLLWAYGSYGGGVYLSWHDNSSNEDGFSIERKLGDPGSQYQFEVIGTTLANVTSYYDSTAQVSNTYTYRLNAFNENGYSPYSNWKTATPFVPVELTSFTATTEKGRVLLNWATATETNNLGFEIERKIINNSNEGEWITIGFKEGYGTTAEPKEYFYMDDISKITTTSLAYRLKQIDIDGSYKYSEEVLVDNPAPVNFALHQNFPNPYNSTTIITYSLPIKSSAIIKIYNSLGAEVEVLLNEKKEAGKHRIDFNASDLPSGIYFYRLQAGNFIETKKMVLLK